MRNLSQFNPHLKRQASDEGLPPAPGRTKKYSKIMIYFSFRRPRGRGCSTTAA
jgi:hypothetical protein